jgi:hypothetical protein
MNNDIRTKIERSSLGTRQAKAARNTVSSVRAADAVARAAQIRQKIKRKAGG